jgi:Super-infection exclusion protein B
MTSITPGIVEALLKSLTDRIAMAVAGVSILLIVLAKSFPTSPAGVWGNAHVTWVWLILTFCVLYLPTRHILQGVDDWDAKRKKQARLEDLTKDERKSLGQYIAGNCRTVWFDHQDAVAKGLAEEGILYCPDVPRRHTGQVAYNMHEWVRQYLKKRPKLFGIE